MATIINNKVLMIIFYKFDHAELIGNHYFRIGGKIKEKCLRTRLPPPLIRCCCFFFVFFFGMADFI